MPARNQDRHERGSVTILALWGVALIAVMLAAAGFTSRIEVRITENAVGTSRARLAAEAGTQLGLERLLDRRGRGVAEFDGRAENWKDGSIRVDISIVEEAGKIDLNEAPAELLAGLFVAVGRGRDEAGLLACAILDWRGETADFCPEPGSAVAPQNHRFAVPEELAQLPGFDEALYQAIADYVTVATGASAIDPLVAARTVLLAIPGATPELVDAFLESRDMWRDAAAGGAGGAGLGAEMALVPAASFLMASPRRDFTIEAVATAGSARYRADLQVRLTDLPRHPYEILAMRAVSTDRRRVESAPPRRVP